MKVFYVPYKNRNSQATFDAESAFTEDILNNGDEIHLAPTEEATLFFYLNSAESGLLEPLKNHWPFWLTRVEVLVTPLFSAKEGEDRALELAGCEPSNIILVEPFVPNTLTEDEVKERLAKGRDRWHWSYCLPFPLEGENYGESAP